ncbi:MAG: CDP-diacylglycerol--serine O-phosphatidyltransferase [Deltaproteobacteria bacterium]|nr:CDP-diacylglycerol--serine O-phosphatidyltransferase [Deltaproteobacteria bacterium]
MSAEIKKRRPRKKRWRQFNEESEIHLGAYIIPNLFTTANLFSGFFGIINSINGRFEVAAVAIIVSCIFDILDGKVARLTRATSRFGVEYDSLADLVAFGVGPGLLMYLWALKPFGRLGWLAAFLFMACGALRLARFNVQAETASKKYFTGLPIPGAASMVATTVLFCHEWAVSSDFYAVNLSFLLMTYLLGFLMVSNVPFNSFKEVEMIKAKPLPVLFGAVMLLTIIAVNPSSMLFVLAVIYVCSGPVGYLFLHRRITRTVQAPDLADKAPQGQESPDQSQPEQHQ